MDVAQAEIKHKQPERVRSEMRDENGKVEERESWVSLPTTCLFPAEFKMSTTVGGPSSISILKKRPTSQGGAPEEHYWRKTARGKLQRGQSIPATLQLLQVLY
jgi:hypothetical protein